MESINKNKSFDSVLDESANELFNEQKKEHSKQDFIDFLIVFLGEINEFQLDKVKLRDKWFGFSKDELLEILACLQDSDRYIIEGQKNKMIEELEKRCYHK